MPYINTKTNEFPLFIGDIPFYESDWTEDQPVPDYFVEVEVEPIPTPGENQVYESRQPEFIDGKWVQKHFVRVLTDEEIAAQAVKRADEIAKIKELGLQIPTQLAVLDENGNMIIDVYGNPVEPIV